MENRKIFNRFRDVLRFRYETGKKQLRIFAGFGLSRHDTVLCNNLFGNTEISSRTDHELVKNTPNAARIGHELTEIRDDSRDFLSR